MKKSATNFFFILLVALGWVGNTFAQAPEGIIYQAEARDENGNPIRNQTLDVLIKIIQDDAFGPVVWEGSHEVTTSNYGIFVLVIGHGTNTSVYVFEDIDWGNHSHFLNVQVKKKNSATWIDMGTQQLLSVPYALHSKTAAEALTADYNNLFNTPINISEFNNDAGYLTREEDADPDPGNELITDIILNGTILEITEASILKSVDLGSLSGDVYLAELEYRVARLEAIVIDNDGDGFTISEGDCNDADPSIYPGALEICSDGIDQDCDGSDLVCSDNDGDGYFSNIDCNDADPSIYPGAPEIWDGIDNNCNGEIDEGWWCNDIDISDGCTYSHYAGTIEDRNDDVETVFNTAKNPNDEDWIYINTVDGIDLFFESYNIKFSFMNNSLNNFVFDVYEGNCYNQVATSVTEFVKVGTLAADDSQVYYVKVYLKDSSIPMSCYGYTILFRNGDD